MTEIINNEIPINIVEIPDIIEVETKQYHEKLMIETNKQIQEQLNIEKAAKEERLRLLRKTYNMTIFCEVCQCNILLKSKRTHNQSKKHLAGGKKPSTAKTQKDYAVKHRLTNVEKYKNQQICQDCGGTFVHASKQTHLRSIKHRNGVMMKELAELKIIIDKQ